jgi:hypothetical protein
VDSSLVERLSSFLKDTEPSSLQEIRKNLVIQLVNLNQISGKILSIDSCPIKANVRENNLKTSVTDRFDKTKIPKGDSDCRLGVIIHFPNPFEKEIQYFWGYRNHVVTDTSSELPIYETTKPANESETKLFIPLLQASKDDFNLPIESVVADAAYDSESNLNFVIHNLKAKPYHFRIN